MGRVELDRLGLSRDEWFALSFETRKTIERSCLNKGTYEDAGHARRDAARLLRTQGSNVAHYRCVFCTGWHVGHHPSMEAVARTALAIREVHGNRPTPVEPGGGRR